MTIYKEVGRKYEDVLILPRVPEVVKAVVAHYDASSLISNRDAVAEQMDAQLRSVLAQYNIDLSYISITNFDFTDTFTDAVEAKVKAQQEKEKAETDADQRRVEDANNRLDQSYLIGPQWLRPQNLIVTRCDGELGATRDSGRGLDRPVRAEAAQSRKKSATTLLRQKRGCTVVSVRLRTRVKNS